MISDTLIDLIKVGFKRTHSGEFESRICEERRGFSPQGRLRHVPIRFTSLTFLHAALIG